MAKREALTHWCPHCGVPFGLFLDLREHAEQVHRVRLHSVFKGAGERGAGRRRAACGTEAGYYAHRRGGEVTCDDCRAAMAAKARERKKARAAP